MVQEQFENLVSIIGAKHKTIGIKDKGLAERLAKLYNDIYCDANNGEYTFGMYKGLLNCNKMSTDEEFKYFIRRNILFNQFVINSVFVNTLCCLRRITDKGRKTQSITRLQQIVKCEICDRIPNDRVVDWFNALEEKHIFIRKAMEPLLTYIDKRISHFDPKWESKMKTSKIRDIGNIYNLINDYNITFRRFYEPNYSQISTLISNGETDASHFISTFHSCERLDDLRTSILKLLYIERSQLE